jgi:hypothetical protein
MGLSSSIASFLMRTSVMRDAGRHGAWQRPVAHVGACAES